MNKYILLASVTLLMACSNNSEDGIRQDRSIDEQERPIDWSAEWKFQLEVSEVGGERDLTKVTDFESSQPIQGLVDQLYKLAFSGDAKVYAPNLFGELDASATLSPEELLKEFESYDTVTVEDLMTGALTDTVIDNSFSLQKVSSLSLAFNVQNGNDLELVPTYVAFGIQVFDEQTGRRRGDRPKMYLTFNGVEPNPEGMDVLKIYSDSLAVFRPDAFLVYQEQSNYSLSDYISKSFGDDAEVELRMNVNFSFSGVRLNVTDIRVAPISKEESV